MSAPSSAYAFSSGAGAGEEQSVENTALVQMEERAAHADLREKCYLFTELVKGYSDIASQQIAAGQMERASISLQHIQHVTDLIHAALAGNAKKLKEAELMLHAASHRLGETIRYVSAEDKATVQMTLRKLDKLNDEMLTLVFAH
jgi:pyridoxal/pyridoxine/pyridoxamine kinase